MSSLPDDVPWPELGNVSRGATRGNQGQKGVLGPSDSEGRAIIQLRVQPGVLQVRLNRKTTEWYRILYGEVDRALKLTKTFWRKARRRQDYESHARADQDHMELSEWLQQLKDKTMSHLELLMQKGEIQGPPYDMRDDIELGFLRKFIERHHAGIPHHPRLRAQALSSRNMLIRPPSADSPNGEPHDDYYQRGPEFMDHRGMRDGPEGMDRAVQSSSRTSISPSMQNMDVNGNHTVAARQSIQCAQTTLVLARKQTQEAFMRYTACLDAERQAQQQFDDLMASMGPGPIPPTNSESRRSSTSLDDPNLRPSEYDSKPNFTRSPDPARARLSMPKAQDWVPPDDSHHQGVYLTEPSAQFDHINSSRKHPRSWYSGDLPEDQYHSYGQQQHDMGEPPKKRIQRMLPGFEAPQNMPIPPHSMPMSS